MVEHTMTSADAEADAERPSCGASDYRSSGSEFVIVDGMVYPTQVLAVSMGRDINMSYINDVMGDQWNVADYSAHA
jgi:hypothetical protein